MNKPSIAELLIASGNRTFTPGLITRAVDTLYANVGAGLDERDWDAILASNDPLAAAEAGLVAMYGDKDFLLRNANHLSANYGAAQIEYTYRQIADRLEFSHSPEWATGTRYESVAELDDSAVSSQARRDQEQRQENDNGGGGAGVIQITAQNANVSTTTDVNATASTTNGDDTIETQFTFLSGTTIDGGGGTDTLEVTDGGAFTLNNITNVEILDLTGANTASTVTQMGNDFERVDLSAQGDTITATGLQDLDINGGAGADTVIYTAFDDLFNTGFRPSVIKALLNGGGGTDTIRVDDAISSANNLNFNRATSFERLVQNDTGAADITIIDAQDLQEIDISAATNASTVDISGANVGMTITGGSAVDQITGSTDIDEISGGAGDDVIDGGGGDDTIAGGIGDDTIDVGAGDNMVEMTGTIANLGRDEVSEFTVGADDIFQFTGANIGDGNTTLTFSSAAAVNAGANAELTVATTALADDAAITAAIQGSTETTPSLFVFYNNNDTEAQVWYDADPNLDGGETELVGLPDVAQADLGNITVTNFVDLV